MSADGEGARKALQEALHHYVRPDTTQAEYELAVDAILARLWIAGFVVTGRDFASEPPDQPQRTGLAS